MNVAPQLAAASLAERAIGRDAQAFDALVRPRLAAMLRTATAIIGDEDDARDALQETLSVAWRGVSALRDPDRFDAWLARILINECRHAIRHRSRRRVRELRLDRFGAPMDGIEPDGSVGELRSDADVARDAAARWELERAFDRLNADDRAVLVLHHLDERPIREIARVLGVPEGTIKSRLHAARASLERALERERT